MRKFMPERRRTNEYLNKISAFRNSYYENLNLKEHNSNRKTAKKDSEMSLGDKLYSASMLMFF
ncbi:MAG: hypothetical protein ACI4NE_02450 [Succinivibrio sp.]